MAASAFQRLLRVLDLEDRQGWRNRAVIGGLLLATVTTLFFVPVMYSILRRKAPKVDAELEAL